jgi:hypothetical protein
MVQVILAQSMNLKLRVFTLSLMAALLAVPARAAEVELQAEDALHCPGAELPEETRRQLAALVEERKALARSITIEDFSMVPTLFGVRIDLPEEVVAWRAKESERVRQLVPASTLERIEAFAVEVRDRSSEFERRYPLKQNLGVGLTKSVRKNGEEKILEMDLSVTTESSDYKISHECVVEEDGKLLLKVTLVRPSHYAVMDKEPAPSELKAQISQSGLPKSVEIWTRTIDETLPLSLAFKRVGSVPLAGDS